MPNSQRTRAAADGSAVGFAALTGFSDAAGIGVSTDYVSVRTGASGTNGWATHGIVPPQEPLPFVAATHFMEPLYWGEFSDDLSRGVFRSFSPITDAPNVANEQNLYLRTDLLTPGAGSYRLVTDCPGCSAPLPAVTNPFALNDRSFLAGASQDFGHIVFESTLRLTADATADPDAGIINLYEWDHGTVRLVGILPDGTAAPQSQAGQQASAALYTPHTISSDGSRIFFTVAEGSCFGLGGSDCGELYVRVNHATTLKLNASEKTNGGGPGGTDDGGPQPASYWNASADGLRAFFVTTEALTNDAPVSGDRKLYMYSATPDAQGHHLTFLSTDTEPADNGFTSDDVKGVIGASADGRTVYFTVAGGQLVAGAPTDVIPGVDDRIYRWHDGALAYVGAFPSENEQPNQNVRYDLFPKQARVSPDGRFLLFTSTSGAGLTGYDHGSCPGNGTSGSCRELYLYRADQQPHLVCVSCNPSGAPATANATDVVRTAAGASTDTYHLNHALSDDGRRVFFSTAEALVPQDTNGKSDAYEYDARDGTVHLLSSGTDSSDSYFMDASRNGDDAFFVTRQRLVGWDVDGGYDIYDARVGGGVPEPVGQVSCTADTCRGAVHAAPGQTAPASAAIAGSNAKPKARSHARRHPLRCRRGFVRKKVHQRVRCVKTKRRHRKGR